MNPWVLTPDLLHEPWRAWTCHLAHHDLQHALENGLALAAPFLLGSRRDRHRTLGWLPVWAPLLSLALLPFLDGGTFRGISGLACAAWAYVGVRMASRREDATAGLLVLALLVGKFTVEGLTGSGLVQHDLRWQTLSASHLLGAVLGLASAALDRLATHVLHARPVRRWARRQVTFPR